MPHVNLTAKQEAFCQGIADGLGQCYVYGLIDSRDNNLFYVGKGSGNRISQHVKNAKAGKSCNDVKHNRICQILDEGGSVIEKIIFSNLSEAASLKIEKYLIKEYRSQLTNISYGNNPRGSGIARQAKALLDIIPAKNLWLKGWHPDCLKGFGGIDAASIFYDDMVKTLQEMTEKGFSHV